jgi:hypothetical protein
MKVPLDCEVSGDGGCGDGAPRQGGSCMDQVQVRAESYDIGGNRKWLSVILESGTFVAEGPLDEFVDQTMIILADTFESQFQFPFRVLRAIEQPRISLILSYFWQPNWISRKRVQ